MIEDGRFPNGGNVYILRIVVKASWKSLAFPVCCTGGVGLCVLAMSSSPNVDHVHKEE